MCIRDRVTPSKYVMLNGVTLRTGGLQAVPSVCFDLTLANIKSLTAYRPPEIKSADTNVYRRSRLRIRFHIRIVLYRIVLKCCCLNVSLRHCVIASLCPCVVVSLRHCVIVSFCHCVVIASLRCHCVVIALSLRHLHFLSLRHCAILSLRYHCVIAPVSYTHLTLPTILRV